MHAAPLCSDRERRSVWVKSAPSRHTAHSGRIYRGRHSHLMEGKGEEARGQASGSLREGNPCATCSSYINPTFFLHPVVFGEPHCACVRVFSLSRSQVSASEHQLESVRAPPRESATFLPVSSTHPHTTIIQNRQDHCVQPNPKRKPEQDRSF